MVLLWDGSFHSDNPRANHVHWKLQGALQSPDLKQNLSIAYYNAVDSNQLGGVDYEIPTAPV